MSQIVRSEQLNFLFDIIVTHLEMTKDRIDNPAGITANIKFNKKPLTLTASRINVTDFKPGRQTEFTAEPNALRKNLEDDGLTIAIRYSGATLGSATIEFPPEFTDRIDAGMNDLMHSASCALIRANLEVGKATIMCMLTIKCEEPPQPDVEGVTCRELAANINDPDIMFVIGEPNPCINVNRCEEQVPAEEGDERLGLDLARYRKYNERVLHAPEDTLTAEACCQLKRLTMQYGDIIDSVVKQVSELPTQIADDDKIFTDWAPKPQQPVDRRERTIPVPVGDLEVEGIKPIRFCPVCLTAMSYLPKYAPCPTCAAKPMPQLDEMPDPPLSATQIIKEYVRDPPKFEDDYCIDPCDMKEPVNDDPCATCRCTCKFGKFCAHCRIRKLCADIFNPKAAEAKKCPKTKASVDEDFRIIAEPEDECRPYLERVFSELKYLYDKRDAKKLNDLKNRCTNSQLSFRNPDGSESDTQTVSSTASISAPLGPPSFLQRQSPPKIGHKDCMKREDAVSKRHGWAWASSKEARKYGWRPGAICRYVGSVMRFFLEYTPEQNAYNRCRQTLEELQEKQRQLPTLSVRKQNGAILITLRALNSNKVEMKPIIFKVVKSDLAMALREIKQALKAKGFRKCTCHKALKLCNCRDTDEKQNLEHAVKRECSRRGMQNCEEQLILTDTSESEMEYDFDLTPPAGVPRPPRRLKPRYVNTACQTSKKDLVVPPRYPISIDPYYRSYDCAVGDRFTSTAFGAPGEDVFEDGIFGFGGGGPHGAGNKQKNKAIWGSKPGGPMRGGGGGRVPVSGGPGGPHGPRGGGFNVTRSDQGAFGKSFPAKPKSAPSKPIPVRMPQRYYKAIEDKAKAEEKAKEQAIQKKKQGPDMMKYLMEKGTVATPWNPNEPKGKEKTKSTLNVGEDGLTDAQRRRKALSQNPMPPFETLAKLGKGYDPCIPHYFDACAAQCYYPRPFYC
ncbi:uncharacterized protein LOC108604780 [Drosophila busckii]|uniref:uncharacterized protein LOC108604780 n=1 Tax=Drosophila busckii TaxID=30019 RepID=UPI00083E99AF|nr:uncharacterized protein LOC108604780 [Drosophila busckii]